jgi:hypothetical protein
MKRLFPQLISKLAKLKQFNSDSTMAVVVDTAFSEFLQLPELQTVPQNQADFHWMVVKLQPKPGSDRYEMRLDTVIPTSKFALLRHMERGSLDRVPLRDTLQKAELV